AEHLSVRDRERLGEGAPGPEWRASTGLVEDLRARKDPGEVAWIERAGAMACRALERTLSHVEAGATELEVTAELEYRLREEGSEGPAFESIVAAGPRSALPHARPSDRALAEGDLLLLDFGAVAGGYRSDITRTVVIGEPSSWQLEIHGAVLAARRAALEAAAPGVPAREVDGAARASLEAAGHGERFGHATGHGLGLEVHEAPGVSRRSDAILQEGHVVTIEPGVYLPGRGGVRVEDDVLLEAGGARLLTDFPLALREL
ncbi:MAG TPA: M24 family metallopeptidase, partial [Gemmatimonadota bacterium]|nr:M24 family metallopeptidase [Gemmatimonadota bacterium]